MTAKLTPDLFGLAKRIAAGLISNPVVLFAAMAAAVWLAQWVASTDWRTSHPRTLSDRQLMQNFKNANRGLYGIKPHYREIDDPTAGTIR